MQSPAPSRSTRIAFALMASLSAIACEKRPVGPTLAAVQVSNVRLQPTEGNATLCCCRVAAVAENRNAVPVHVTIKFFAYDDDPRWPLTSIVHFIENMRPDARESFVAPGLLLACSRIRDVRVEVDVTGTASALP
jgi:hypothetical protein